MRTNIHDNIAKDSKMNHILHEVKTIVESHGHKNVWGIFLIGSQNYNLDTETSDFDFNVFVIPTIDDLLNNSTTSTTYKSSYGEINVYDIRKLSELINKFNPSMIEVLYSKYTLIPDNETKSLSDKILETGRTFVNNGKLLSVDSMAGTIYNMKKSVVNKLGDEKKESVISSLGYYPKYLVTALRYYHILKGIIAGTDFSELISLDDGLREYLLSIKSGVLSEEDATELLKDLVDRTGILKESIRPLNVDVSTERTAFNKAISELIKHAIKKEIV